MERIQKEMKKVEIDASKKSKDASRKVRKANKARRDLHDMHESLIDALVRKGFDVEYDPDAGEWTITGGRATRTPGRGHSRSRSNSGANIRTNTGTPADRSGLRTLHPITPISNPRAFGSKSKPRSGSEEDSESDGLMDPRPSTGRRRRVYGSRSKGNDRARVDDVGAEEIGSGVSYELPGSSPWGSGAVAMEEDGDDVDDDDDKKADDLMDLSVNSDDSSKFDGEFASQMSGKASGQSEPNSDDMAVFEFKANEDEPDAKSADKMSIDPASTARP